MAILRGELYFVELGPTKGHEINDKRRPVLVVSTNYINSQNWVVITVPGTTRTPGKRVYPHEVRIEPSGTNGLGNPTVFLCSQMKALDYGRFDRPPIGVLAAAELRQIEQTVKLCLGLM